MSPELSRAVEAVAEGEWKTFGKEEDGTLRQWAEVDFVPSRRYEHKDSRPLRYVGLRLLKAQGVRANAFRRGRRFFQDNLSPSRLSTVAF